MTDLRVLAEQKAVEDRVRARGPQSRYDAAVHVEDGVTDAAAVYAERLREPSPLDTGWFVGVADPGAVRGTSASVTRRTSAPCGRR